jgi:signal transduction histidine kinase
MRPSEIWRTSTFRNTALYGLVFALGAMALLGMIYIRSAVFLTRRVDGILNVQMDALARAPQKYLKQRISDALTLNGDKTNAYALFSPTGVWQTGNWRVLPKDLRLDGRPLETTPTKAFPAAARLIARRLDSGDILVVGRDISQLREMRAIIGSALLWSGLSIILIGVACGTVLSIRPLRRLRILNAVGQDIAAGNLERRMPVSSRHDELDMFATTVNHMMGEVERLMSEVKGATETIAHDLRTPLTRARVHLHRIDQAAKFEPDEIARVTAEIDTVLERFRALLRISELEARKRWAGFTDVDLADIIDQVVELYQPLAEALGVRLSGIGERGLCVQADAKLLFEAVSNLVDNGIKFAGENGWVEVRLGQDVSIPQIIVQDGGPGIPEAERSAVLQRFYRSERDRLVPGSGLGLSIVTAIVRLHKYQLILEDGAPGLRATIQCLPHIFGY